jgi:hypothetical protein
MPACPPIRHASLLVSMFVAPLLACSDTIAPPAERDAVSVEGAVVDATGAPLAGAFAVLRVATSVKELPWHGDAPYAVTGSDGRYSLAEAELTGSVDSVTVEVYPPGCVAPRSTATRRGELLPADFNAPIGIDVTADPVSPQARTELGEMCAAGAEPFWGVRSYIVVLRIESTDAGVVSGGWGVYYTRTSVGPEGRFQGVMADGLIVLDLDPDEISAPDCGGVRLAIPVSAEGDWGAADIVRNEGCIPGTAPLNFTRSIVP